MQPFPNPSDATQNLIKICHLASEIFKFENVDNDGRRLTNNGPLVYYKLTLWAFGSGEPIKIKQYTLHLPLKLEMDLSN